MSLNIGSFARAADKSATGSARAQTWRVYDHYALVEHEGDRYITAAKFAKPRNGEAIPNTVYREYSPLLVPALFVEFTQMASELEVPTRMRLRADGLEGRVDLSVLDTPKNSATVLGWCQTWGLLGLTPHLRAGAWWGDDRGGKADKVGRVVLESWTAGEVLTLYQAATALAGPDLKVIGTRLPGRRFRSQQAARDAALSVVETQVQQRLERYSHHRIYRRPDGSYMPGFGFRNLLGGLWQQILFLMVTPAEDVRRCPWCGGVVAIEPPEPPPDPGQRRNARGRYKTRKDKRFCSDSCRALHSRFTRKKRKLS